MTGWTICGSTPQLVALLLMAALSAKRKSATVDLRLARDLLWNDSSRVKLRGLAAASA